MTIVTTFVLTVCAGSAVVSVWLISWHLGRIATAFERRKP